MIEAVLDAALGVVDLGQSLDTDTDEDVGIFVSQLNDLGRVVTVGAQLEKS